MEKTNSRRNHRNTVSIDGDRLRDEILERYASLKEAGLKALPRRSGGYIASCCLSGRMGRADIRRIEEVLGIPRSRFVIDPAYQTSMTVNATKEDLEKLASIAAEPVQLVPAASPVDSVEAPKAPGLTLTISVNGTEELGKWMYEILFQALRDALNS